MKKMTLFILILLLALCLNRISFAAGAEDTRLPALTS